jgi:hypothetical protein
MAVDLDDVHGCALKLPRTEEHLIRQYVKFRVGKIVYASVSPYEEIMGFGYPREERAELLTAVSPAAPTTATSRRSGGAERRDTHGSKGATDRDRDRDRRSRRRVHAGRA